MEWFTKSKASKELEKNINCISNLINKLEANIEKSEIANKSYNRLMIERAESRKNLSELKEKKPLFKLLKKKPKEKRICDYFAR